MTGSDPSGGCAGLILAGGRARRMGGLEKGLALWRGRPLVAAACEALRPHCRTLLISANRQLDAHRSWADAVVADDSAFEDAGPLAGLLAGLERARAQGADGVLVMPCDTPAVTAAVMGVLAADAQANPQRVVLAKVSDRLHPLHGYYPVSLAEALRDYLAQGGRKVMGFAASYEPLFPALPADEDSFRNLNAPEDWAG
ncbi:molybdenum cofactor guanylyltransferase MobA [Marinobacter sp. JSM 1782161]|uniref:molybdenum cofactor guanylyltransferase MobA n=1 Tax=Marinobacter sp. JSM 1782161 TaxID=2685906 RepID=UPI00140263B1|nr:molybdenum cofactor guanylyltransferase MobA [Marinobacter sp. JSM 1782161]